MFTSLTSLFGSGRDQGFTLIEMLIVILIIGILAAVGVPLYIGYTHDAKLAEGKALAGSVLTAMQACVQTIDPTGAQCLLANVAPKVGLSTSGTTGDGRWTVTAGTLSLSSGANGSTWSSTSNINVAGQATDLSGLTAMISITNGTVKMYCVTSNGGAATPC